MTQVIADVVGFRHLVFRRLGVRAIVKSMNLAGAIRQKAAEVKRCMNGIVPILIGNREEESPSIMRHWLRNVFRRSGLSGLQKTEVA